MPTHISLLRGVNVAGRKVDMAGVRDIYVSAGAMNVRTYIQSWNIVFESGEEELGAIVKRTRELMMERFKLEVYVITMSPVQLKEIVGNLPFRQIDEGKLHVTFLSSPPVRTHCSEFEKARDTSEKFYIGEREIYLYCPNGYGRTKLTNSFIERKLCVKATTRNWRTVNSLLAIAGTGNYR